jgi:single-strand DNA-binding protein
MFQQTIVIGNLGNDPEARCTPTGKWVTHFSLAVNERYGEKESTTWFRVEAWGKLGELCQQYLAKGRLVMVVGRVSANAFTGQDGKARCSLTLTAQTVKFLGAGKGGQDVEAHADQPADQPAEDDCPF